MNLPLESIRVLDLSRILTGPFCSMILADLGAEVIKVERPEKGDDTRSWGPPFIEGESAYFLSVNRNKKSMTLNLKNKAGKKLLYKLVEKCDVLLENFSPDVTKKLQIDYETIKEINPNIIYCSISGFGQTGPYRSRSAYDLVIQGIGGLMGITGEPDRSPVRVGVAITDMGAGMYAVIAILSALLSRKKNGKGQWIDISLLDSTVSWMTYMAANYFATGKIPPKMGSAHPNIVPYQCFRALDKKYLTLAVGNDNIWKNFCKVLNLNEFIEDKKFVTNSKRVENRKELINILTNIFLTKKRDKWLAILREGGVPSGPVYKMDELFKDMQIQSRDMVVEINHPNAGNIKQVGTPIKSSKIPVASIIPPPLLGQNTEEILEQILGYSKDEIVIFKKEGAI